MSKDLLANIMKKMKKCYKRNLVKDIKLFLKKKKKKTQKYSHEYYKYLLKMKKKTNKLVEYRKKIL